jgi:hypothetical protein
MMWPRSSLGQFRTSGLEGTMKTLVSAVAAALVSLHAVDPAYAGAPDWLLNIPLKYWIDIFALLFILNLLCCWWRRR